MWGTPSIEIFVDADACPVKDEIYLVASRYRVPVSVVANSRIHVPPDLGAELVLSHERVHAMIQRHLADVAAGALQIVVDRTFRLADAAAAHAFIESRQAFGRVVLIP